MKQLPHDRETHVTLSEWLSVGWLGKPWVRLELAFLLAPVFISALLVEWNSLLTFRGLLACTLLLGNWTALFVLVTRRYYLARPASRDRLIFYLLALAGVLVPYLIFYALSQFISWLPDERLRGQYTLLRISMNGLAGFASMPNASIAALLVLVILFALHEVDSSRQRRESRSRKFAIDTESSQALEIQRHLLPLVTPQIPGFQIACAWQPAKAVSGDYFDVLLLDGGRLGLCIADVAGKGMAASLLMADLQASVKALAPHASSPSMLCAKLNSVLCETVAPGKFVSFFYAVIDPVSKQLCYENAGQCLPLLVHADGSISMPASYSGVLGVFSHWTFQNTLLQFASGDCLILLTDGVLSAVNGKEEEFGYRRLMDVVSRNRKFGVQEICTEILEAVSTFCGGRFEDDASLIVVTVT